MIYVFNSFADGDYFVSFDYEKKGYTEYFMRLKVEEELKSSNYEVKLSPLIYKTKDGEILYCFKAKIDGKKKKDRFAVKTFEPSLIFKLPNDELVNLNVASSKISAVTELVFDNTKEKVIFSTTKEDLIKILSSDSLKVRILGENTTIELLLPPKVIKTYKGYLTEITKELGL